MRPLICSIRQTVIALDPETGTKIWSQELGYSPQKMFQVGNSLFIAVKHSLYEIELSTGQLVNNIKLGFEVISGLVRNEKLYVSGDGVACLGINGKIYWNAKEEIKNETLFKRDSAVVCRSAENEVLWETKLGDAYIGDGSGMVLDGDVCQPDRTD